MLLDVDLTSKIAERIRGKRLKDFGLDERAFQEILYNSLDKLIPDDEFILLMQSRRWQEEPDLMAIDKEGRLFIFELKAWESRSENILQVLRYGQIFGSYKYEDLNRLFQKFEKEGKTLKEAYLKVFGRELNESAFNKEQVFVVVTNGIDLKQERQSNIGESKDWIYVHGFTECTEARPMEYY